MNLVVFPVFMAELLGAVVQDDQQGSLTGEPLRSRAFEASTCSFCHSHRGEKPTVEPVTLKTGGKFVFIGHQPHVFAQFVEKKKRFSGQLQVVFTRVMTELLQTAAQVKKRACLLCDTRGEKNATVQDEGSETCDHTCC